jgi:hypothetical protein
VRLCLAAREVPEISPQKPFKKTLPLMTRMQTIAKIAAIAKDCQN